MKKQKVLNTEVEKVKAIKRINERRAEIQRGVLDNAIPKHVLTQYDNAIAAAVKDLSLLTKSGNISHGSKAVSEITATDLEGLLTKETAAHAKGRLADIYEQEQLSGHELPDDYNMKKFINDYNLVQKTLDEDYAEYYNAIKTLREKWTKDDWNPSYHDIARSIRSERIKRGRSEAAARRALL